MARDFSICPRCNSPTQKCKAFNGGESEFWYECVKCNTYINTYIPQKHQAAFHEDKHRYTGNFGGYGSGKTLTSREELYKHIFLSPAGNGLIGANVATQYENTIKRDIENDMPIQFIAGWSTQKQYIDMINKFRLMFRPFDDPDKLRSLNLSIFVIVEASEVKSEAFTQLKTRLRNIAAAVPERDEEGNILYRETETGVLIPLLKADWRKGIIESNPDSGWIRSNVLMMSDDIQKHGRIADTYSVLEAERDPAISSHVTATECNEFLPPNFRDELCKNKPAWWIARYLYGSFVYAEGLVYPSAMRYICPAFEIPRHWKRIVAFDYGLSDNAVFLFGAIDEDKGIVYIYREVVTNNRSVEQLAKLYHEAAEDIPIGGLICQPIIDPKSGPKRDYDKKTLSDHFLDYGIAFKPGHVNLDARIYRLNTYLECGKLRIMDNCTSLIGELREYKFKARSLDNKGWDDKPVDKDNHAINPLEWITMELPSDPRNLVNGIYNRKGEDLTKPKDPDDAIQRGMWALSDPDDYKMSNDSPYEMDYIF